jgi:hypothetical protein
MNYLTLTSESTLVKTLWHTTFYEQLKVAQACQQTPCPCGFKSLKSVLTESQHLDK